MRAAVPGHPANWDLEAELTAGRTVPVPRGRVVGGSSALNARLVHPGTPRDFDGWAAAGNDLWSYDAVLPAFRRLEADRDFGDLPGHGADGPVPVQRSRAGHPLADGVRGRGRGAGLPGRAGQERRAERPAYGPVPLNVAGGVRVNTAMAYLSPRAGLPGLTVRGGVTVRRVLVEGGRAVGVETADGVVRAAEVVLSAGAVGSPHLLLLSGIGPADELRARRDRRRRRRPRASGAGATDHPQVYVGCRPARPAARRRGCRCTASCTRLAGRLPGDLEVLPWLMPFSRITGAP